MILRTGSPAATISSSKIRRPEFPIFCSVVNLPYLRGNPLVVLVKASNTYLCALLGPWTQDSFDLFSNSHPTAIAKVGKMVAEAASQCNGFAIN